MPSRAHVPWQLRGAPFRGSDAVRTGLITRARLTGSAWRRLFRDVYLSADPEVRLAVEYDGDHHRDRRRLQRDVARLNRLRLLGWTVLRFTADDVLRTPERVTAQVTALLGPHVLGD